MLYRSTRGGGEAVSSREAILRGLAPDGGLYVSDELTATSIDIPSLMDKSFEEIALAVCSALLDDFGEEELREAVHSAYRGRFDASDITPLTRLGDYYLLELYHGPTQAFKDIALSLLPQLMSRALMGHRLMILTATSGDTGKAALEGFRDIEGIGISVFYPEGGVSDIQRLQMATQEGERVFVAGVRGNFDDCQRKVKELFGSLAGEAGDLDVYLSSANSINIGRLVPQIVYYISAYRDILLDGAVSYPDKVDYVVPTGNFGDVLAAWYASCLGLPVGRLVVASDANDILCDFLATGVYDTRRDFVRTISPSMDILISSNLERMLYYASGGDADYVSGLMRSLAARGSFSVSPEVLGALREVFDFGSASEKECREAVREAYLREGRLIDTHTAVAYKVALERDSAAPTVILATASPFKFAPDVYTSIYGGIPGADGWDYMERLSERTGETLPDALGSLRDKEIRHSDVLDIDRMGDFVLDAIHKAYG